MEVVALACFGFGGCAAAFRGDGEGHGVVFQGFGGRGGEHFVVEPEVGAGFHVSEKVQARLRRDCGFGGVGSGAGAGAHSGRGVEDDE